MKRKERKINIINKALDINLCYKILSLRMLKISEEKMRLSRLQKWILCQCYLQGKVYHYGYPEVERTEKDGTNCWIWRKEIKENYPHVSIRKDPKKVYWHPSSVTISNSLRRLQEQHLIILVPPGSLHQRIQLVGEGYNVAEKLLRTIAVVEKIERTPVDEAMFATFNRIRPKK